VTKTATAGRAEVIAIFATADTTSTAETYLTTARPVAAVA
jgi:hypothetical protein